MGYNLQITFLVYVKFLSITKKVSSSNKAKKYLQAPG